MEYSIIVACTSTGGIAKDGKIPWDISADMARFARITTETECESSGYINAVIMGRKTWESLPDKHRPLRGRINIVISSTLNQDDITGARVARSLTHAHALLREYPSVAKVFVIGGATLYTEALRNFQYTSVYMTLVKDDILCDTFFPMDMLYSRYHIDYQTFDMHSPSGVTYSFSLLTQRPTVLTRDCTG